MNNLPGQKHKDGLNSPEDYFSTFNARVLARIKEERQPRPLFGVRIRRGISSAAAVLLLGIGYLGYRQFGAGNTVQGFESLALNQEELSLYVDNLEPGEEDLRELLSSELLDSVYRSETGKLRQGDAPQSEAEALQALDEEFDMLDYESEF